MSERETLYDRVLIKAALLAPFALIVLAKWRSSLETDYAPLEPGARQVFGVPFQQKASEWIATSDDRRARLVLVTDRECPCTRSTRAALDTAIASSPRRDVAFVERDVRVGGDAAWQAVLDEVPATPTLFAIDNGQLVYAGPVNSGTWCTRGVSEVLGLTALQAQGSGAVLNWLGNGCYCRMPER